MGYYEEAPPRHGHRSPSELSEDELLSSLHGDFCGMPATIEEIGPIGAECIRPLHVSLLLWGDAHPLEVPLR